MGCLGKGLGVLLLAAWVIGGIYFLVEQKAHGENLILPVIVLGWGVLTVAALALLAMEKVLPRGLRLKGPGGTALLLALGLGPTLAIFLMVDANVANRRPAAELTAALAPACAGTPVSGAGAVTRDGSAPNHLVVLDPDGKDHAWTGYPSLELRPETLADAQLVVCIDNDAEETVLEVCRYSNGPNITRYAVSRRVRVVAAATGATLFDEAISAEPRTCRQTEQKEVTELKGDLGWDQVEEALWYVINHGTSPADVVELTRPVLLEPGVSMEAAFLVTNDGQVAMSVPVLMVYPGDVGSLTQDVLVRDLASGETRIVSVWLNGISAVSSMAIEARLGPVERATPDPEVQALVDQLVVTVPTLPLESGATAEVTIRNGSAEAAGFAVRVGVISDGSEALVIATGILVVDRLAAGTTTTVEVVLEGHPDTGDRVIAQLEDVVGLE